MTQKREPRLGNLEKSIEMNYIRRVEQIYSLRRKWDESPGNPAGSSSLSPRLTCRFRSKLDIFLFERIQFILSERYLLKRYNTRVVISGCAERLFNLCAHFAVCPKLCLPKNHQLSCTHVKLTDHSFFPEISVQKRIGSSGSRNTIKKMEIHASMGWVVILSFLGLVLQTKGQQQSQSAISDTIPQNLRDCYNSSYIVTRENLLPMTTTNLIALLRKLEDASYSVNSRLLGPAILLKYRYDGIERHPDVQTTQYVKPYSRTGKEYYLYKLQMNRIIPASSSYNVISDGVLTWKEKCTLHAMLSTSIDKYDRGDGDTPCSKLSKYSEWSARYPRDLSKTGDAEYLWPNYDSHMSGDYQYAVGGNVNYQTATSACPMENGVVYNTYGSIAPGIVLAGIAAGLNYQAVPYNSYFVQPRTVQGQRRQVQTAITHYRNLFNTNQQQNGGRYGGGNGYGQDHGQPGQGNGGYGQGGQGGIYGRPGQGGGSYGQPGRQGNVYGQPGAQNAYDVNNGGYGQGSGTQQNGGYNPYGSGSGGSGSNGYGTGTGNGYGNGNSGNGYGSGGSSYGNGASPYGANSGGSSYGNGGSAYGTNSYGEVDIDNRYAATLAGSLALESLLQGPENLITIGNRGGWNSSSVPKYYFLQDWTTGNVLTDARILGGVDGLYLSTNIQTWTSAVGDIKLSQLFDSYYSDKGVLTSDVKACNRKTNYPQFSSQLNQQTYAVSYMLNNDLPPTVIIANEGVQTFADYAATQTTTYMPSIPVTSCPYNSSGPYALPYADLTVVVDCNWSYRHVAGIFNYLAEQCNFWKYGSNLTIISAKDGSVLADNIQSPLDIPADYNQTVVGGFDFPKVLNQLKMRFLNKLQNSVVTQSPGGLPHIVIFVPMTTTMSDTDKANAQDSINYFKFNIPDVRFLYLVTGSKEIWTPFAYNKDKDVIVAAQGSDLAITLQPLVARIASIPRRLINPNCGRFFNGGTYNQLSLDGYLSPNEINYYRIHPNYFFKDTNARVTISKSYSAPTLMVCQSRDNPLPSRNVSGSDVNCQQLTGSNSLQYTISGACGGDYTASSCNPWYISILNTQTGSSTSNNNNNGNTCKDAQCRFPDQAKYTITHQGLTCYSAGSLTVFSPALLTSILGLIYALRT